jgi:hypothetical protein
MWRSLLREALRALLFPKSVEKGKKALLKCKLTSVRF